MLGKKPYLVPIPGTRKSDRLKENAGASDIKLTEKEIAVLDKQLDAMEMSEVFDRRYRADRMGAAYRFLVSFR